MILCKTIGALELAYIYVTHANTPTHNAFPVSILTLIHTQGV